MLDYQSRTGFFRRDNPHVDEAAGRLGIKVRLFDQAVRIRSFLRTGRNAQPGILVVERPARELLHAARMNAVILPVTVTAKNHEAGDLLVLQPAKKAIALMTKPIDVGMIVDLRG